MVERKKAKLVEGRGIHEDLEPDKPLPYELLEAMKKEAKRLGISEEIIKR